MGSVGVVFGGPSPEHDISILSGLQAAHILRREGRDVVCLYWSKTGRWQHVPAEVEARSFLEPAVPGALDLQLNVPGGFSVRRRLRTEALDLDVVVNCCHGGPGEDGSLAAMLRLAGLQVTGPAPQAAGLAMDKLATAAVAHGAGVPTIPTALITDPSLDIAFPWVVKPRFGGSSIGVHANIQDAATAHALAHQGVARAGAIVQPFLDGWIDLNVAIRWAPEPEISAIERPSRDGQPILDYRAKYLRGDQGMETTPRELPAVIPGEIAERIRTMTRTLAAAMQMSGIPRFDYLWDGDDQVLLCEVNAIPGALGLYLWEAAGVSRGSVLAGWIEEARRTPPTPPQWNGQSDGSALRVAKTVAAKLSM